MTVDVRVAQLPPTAGEGEEGDGDSFAEAEGRICCEWEWGCGGCGVGEVGEYCGLKVGVWEGVEEGDVCGEVVEVGGKYLGGVSGGWLSGE